MLDPFYKMYFVEFLQIMAYAMTTAGAFLAAAALRATQELVYGTAFDIDGFMFVCIFFFIYLFFFYQHFLLE